MSRVDHPPNMKEVAAALGVHQTTVSLALRNHPSIPETTRRKVRAMADRMGYRPNPMVSALIAERKKRQPSRHGSTLGFLTCTAERQGWQRSRNYRRVHEAMVDYAPRLGYKLEEFWLHEPGMTPSRLQQILLHRGIRGLILCPLPGKQHTLDFDFSDFATVALGLTLRQPRLDQISIDHNSLMKLALHHLQHLGYRKIGFITSNVIDDRVSHLQLGAFLAARHHTPEPFAPPISYDKHQPSMIEQWLRTYRLDAVICSTSSEYAFFGEFLSPLKHSLPENFALICLDCVVGTDQAGIIQNLEAEARAAIELVASRVERAQFGIPTHPQVTLINGQWQSGKWLRHGSLSPER